MSMRRFEILFACITAFICLALTVYFAITISSFQELWLFPGLYLVELALLTCATVYLIWRDYPSAAFILWAVTGGIIAFTILAGFSIGPAYMIVAALCILTGIALGVRRKQNWLANLGIFLLGAFLQTVLVLLVLQIT